MPAPKGNNYAMKFKTSEARRALAERYLEHCKQGKSDASFEVDDETFSRYIKDFPEDFATVPEARRIRMSFWEDIGINMATGKGRGNVIAWKFNMQNRFGWKDRNDTTTDDKPLEPFVIYKPEKKPEGAK